MNETRSVYRELADKEKEEIAKIKALGETMLEAIRQQTVQGRHTSIAITKLEEAVMWAVKGITG